MRAFQVRLLLDLFFLIVKHTVAIAFKIRICYLPAEFLAHTHSFFGHFPFTRAMTFFFEYALAYHFDYLVIFVISYLHREVLSRKYSRLLFLPQFLRIHGRDAFCNTPRCVFRDRLKYPSQRPQEALCR